jgi:hypothetical protein
MLSTLWQSPVPLARIPRGGRQQHSDFDFFVVERGVHFRTFYSRGSHAAGRACSHSVTPGSVAAWRKSPQTTKAKNPGLAGASQTRPERFELPTFGL